ncbi:hypothetical protein [Brasilonema sp. UFV-L1]|uniref:hypothetical protein n=1 Tax=Brasilonema sp. UFV-L1 TaxID=2234130 RepID=UPI0030DB4A20
MRGLCARKASVAIALTTCVVRDLPSISCRAHTKYREAHQVPSVAIEGLGAAVVRLDTLEYYSSQGISSQNRRDGMPRRHTVRALPAESP